MDRIRKKFDLLRSLETVSKGQAKFELFESGDDLETLNGLRAEKITEIESITTQKV